MRCPSSLRLGLVVLGIAGCSAETTEDVAQRTEPIVNGFADNTHDAVVAVFSNGGKCSGTIVAVVGNQGYVLSAAHCMNPPPEVVVQADDYQVNPIQYPVVDYAAHPLFDGTYYDFGMIRFTGAGGATPVIPALSPGEDGLVVGGVVDLVGYGQTENGDTSQRRHITRPIATATSLLFGYNQATGGLCFGDSGGPALAIAASGERVAGVSDFVSDASCLDMGFSGRVSAVYDTFIMPFINGGPVGMQTCDQCFEAATNGVGGCVSVIETCFNTPDCDAFVQCLNGCSTQICSDQCAASHSYGVQVYLDIYECSCKVECTAECAGDAMCPAPPACGFTSQNAGCETCFETSCCAQGSACAADNFCSACFAQNPPAGCDNSGLVTAFEDCLTGNCASECNLGSGSGGGGAGGGGIGGDGGAASASGGSGVGGDAPVTSASVGPTTSVVGATTGSGNVGGSAATSKSSGDAEEEGGCVMASQTPNSKWRLVWLLLALGILGARRRRPAQGFASSGPQRKA